MLISILAFIIVILLVVIVHELGHYTVARMCGVAIEVFSFGFGPKLFSFVDKNSTRWQFCILPLGGYVKIKGDNADFKIPENTQSQDKDSFATKHPWQKMAIVLAGPAFNVIFSLFLICAFVAFSGLPNAHPVVEEVLHGSAAERFGLEKHDKILSINGEEIHVMRNLWEILGRLQPGIVRLKLERANEVKDIELELGSDKKFGIKFGAEITFTHASASDIITYGSKYTYNIMRDLLVEVWRLITGAQKLTNLGGVIQIAQFSGDALQGGFGSFFLMIVMLSLNLAVLNLIPIPGLDGGHFVFYFLDCIWIGRFITLKMRSYSIAAGFVLLLGLMIFVNGHDIYRVFTKLK